MSSGLTEVGGCHPVGKQPQAAYTASLCVCVCPRVYVALCAIPQMCIKCECQCETHLLSLHLNSVASLKSDP